MLNGKARQMGLGPADLVTLAEAREKARAVTPDKLREGGGSKVFLFQAETGGEPCLS
jgi:hypothetical protein